MMRPLFCFWCISSFMFRVCVSQDYSFIADIPIENYDPAERQENDMDLELLPRRETRSYPLNSDPKDSFFRSMRSFTEGEDIPRPAFPSVLALNNNRKKRNTEESKVTEQGKVLSGIVNDLGKPLEILPLDAKNLTEPQSRDGNDQIGENTQMSINDFIRFRRSAVEQKGNNKENSPKEVPVSEKLMDRNSDQDTLRKSREITNEQWVKQVYPVRRPDEFAFDDNLPSSSENFRVPRVNFVTQKLSDSGLASTDVRSSGRQARARNLDRDIARDYPKDLLRDESYYDRRPRYYERNRFYRDDLYRYDPRDSRYAYDPRYDNYYSPAPYTQPQKPQKRIIYYATLPELPRNLPNVELRNRYRYDRDMYDDRYLNDPYRGRKGYPKSRYDEEGKIPYPVKVSTDVNVREVKKNPERRIYSEVDRPRYAYNTPPYRAADG
ncbi:uncharacterized protein LOC115882546 [Sitophilus oryzae]|uniref:Uncharacterized protein LOC115882546 n=1 Tax=Sitophilus oryzae TaxID=7048 RepID=A0A6J2Y0K0_SITOR|nr:uncharacterized protein LOC115882546 [Sitophilus oryzae]XP_030756560.1 uncharacterized protein LOC115882546 [Sitophilus oryzae]XP_030756561.1 uncharacterized protein LOC115882546 [Sitophilus oryzae]